MTANAVPIRTLGQPSGHVVPPGERDQPDGGAPPRHRGRLAATLLTGVAIAILAAPSLMVRPEPSIEIVMPDTDLTVSYLVGVVRDAAEVVPGSVPDGDLQIVFTDEVPAAEGQPFVGGRQRGSTVWVRVDGIAMPTRTLLHELAHAVTPGAGHGDRFRDVYLAAMAQVYDESSALREARRLAWVYDRCYVDDSCPVIRPGDDTGSDRQARAP